MLHRITSDKYTEKGSPVVFFQHGLLSCSTTWVINYPDLAPAFQMIRNGYEVWLGNNRGTTFSRNHTSLDPDKDDRFWEFSFQELGDFDTEAQINYVLRETGRQNLTYIGHSQGTTQMFYALATNNEYWKDKINLFVALAPVVDLASTDSTLIKYAAKLDNVAGYFVRLFGKHELFPRGASIPKDSYWCQLIPGCKVSMAFLDSIFYSFEAADREKAYLSHFPNGASLQQLLHFGQILNQGRFQNFDYGRRENLERYGQEEAPFVDVKKIQDIPVALFVGEFDSLANVQGNRWLRDQLGSCVFYKEFQANHASFMTGKDMSYFEIVL